MAFQKRIDKRLYSITLPWYIPKYQYYKKSSVTYCNAAAMFLLNGFITIAFPGYGFGSGILKVKGLKNEFFN